VLYLRTLGGLSLHPASDPDGDAVLANSKSLLVLAILAIRPERALRRDQLAELLWPGTDRRRALRALRQALFFLRRYAADALESGDETVRLRPEGLDVDLWRLDRALEEQRWDDVIALYGGPFAAGLERKGGVELEHLIEAESSRVRAGLEAAYGKAVTTALDAGDVGKGSELAREFVRLHPLDETGQRLLLRALRAAGDDVGAVQAFETYRALLEGLLEEQPDEELRKGIAQLRRELIDPRVGRTAPVMHEPSGPPSPPDETPRASGAPSVVRWWRGLPRPVHWAVPAVLLAGLGLVARALFTGPDDMRDQLLSGVEARLLVNLDGEAIRAVAEVVVGVRATSVRPMDEMPVAWTPASDGERGAFVVQAVDGWNVAYGTGRGEPLLLTTEAGDEYPLAWSPDGRYLLFTRRRLLGDGRTESYGYGMADVMRDTSWTFTRLESRERPVARWAPDGTQIALTADVRGEPEVFVVDFDRGDVRDLSLHAAWDGEPAWSPDGARLAFVSRRDGGTAQLYSVRRDGLDLHRLSQSGTDERTPVWLSPDVIAFAASGDLWATDGTGRTQIRITDRGDVSTVVAVLGKERRWIDSIGIGRGLPTVSPGQVVRLTAEAVDPEGRSVDLQLLPLHWVIGDPALGRIEEPTWLRILGIGSTSVIAGLAGWRSDTIDLISVPLFIERQEPAFVEDWRDGVLADRWRTFGTPQPRTRTSGAPDGGGVFVNDGDEFFASGAMSVVPFALDDGIVVEFDARLQFTRKLHQSFVVALHRDELPDSVLEANRPPGIVELRVVGPAGDRPDTLALIIDGHREHLPMPDGVALWHRYAVQVTPDGTVEFLVDDRMYWRSRPRRQVPRDGAAFLLIGGQSFETELQLGTMRVYRGVKFRLPELATAER
jgi:DNA-binding SARP family transcriptional activator